MARIDFQMNFTANKTSLNEILTMLKQIQNEASKTNLSDGLNNDLKEAANTARQLENILNNSFNSKIGQLDLSKLNSSIKSTYGGVDQLQKRLESVGQGAVFTKLSSDILNTNMQLKQSNKLLDEMATSMANTVKWGITSSIFNQVSNSIQRAYEYAKQLDTSLNDIRIVTGYSAEQMESFAESANRAASSLGASTRDYTEASLIYYQQGLSDEEVQARTETTLKAANVTGQTGDEVSEQLTAIWNGYKVTADETELYIDKVAKVAAATASDLNELSTGMSKVASAAASAGVDIDQLNATLATVISVTREAPETVGTAFRSIYARLGDLALDGEDEFGVSLGTVSGQLEELGIQILDEQGQMRDMGDIVEDVADKWQTWSQAQRQAAAVAMAGKQQYSRLIALFDNWDMYTDALLESQNAMGTLNEQQEIYMDSVEAHLQKLSTEAERTYDILFDTDAVNSMADALTGLLSIFNNWMEGVGGGLRSLTVLGTNLVNIFSKQIGSGISNMVQNYDTQRANANAELLKQNIINNYQAQGQGNITEDSYSAGLNKEVEIASTLLRIKEQLTSEEYNRLTTLQQQSGMAAQQISDAENYKKNITDIFKNEDVSLNTMKKRLKEIQNQNIELENQKTTIEEIGELILQAEEAEDTDERDDILYSILDKEGTQTQAAGLTGQEMSSIYDDIEQNEGNRSKSWAILDEHANAIEQKLQQQYSQEERLNEAIKQRNFYESEGYNQLILEQQARDNIIKQAEQQALRQQAITIAVQGVSSLVGLLTTASGLISTFGDESLDGWEKFTQILTTILMSLPMIITGFQSVKTLIPSLITSFTGLTTAEFIATQGATSLGAAIWSALSPLLPIILPVIAVIGALTAAVYAGTQAYNADAEAAKEAANAAKEVASSAEEATTAYEELISGFDAYDTAVEKLNDLKEGTDEYTEALKSANDEVLNLVKNNQNLAQYVERNDKGLLTFSEDADKVVESARQRMNDAEAASSIAQINANQTQLKSDRTNLIRDMGLDFWWSPQAPITGNWINDAQLQDILDAINENSGFLEESILTNIDGISGNQSLIDTLMETDNKTQLEDLARQTQELSDTNKLLLGESLRSNLESDKTYANMTDAQKNAVANLYEQGLTEEEQDRIRQEIHDELYGDAAFGWGNEDEIQRQYAEARGWTLQDDKWGDKAVYVDEEGNEQEISDDAARAYLENIQIADRLGDYDPEKLERIKQGILGISEAVDGLGEESIAELLGFASRDQEFDAETLSLGMFNEIKEKLNSPEFKDELSKITSDQWQEMGYNDADEYINAISTKLEEANNEGQLRLVSQRRLGGVSDDASTLYEGLQSGDITEENIGESEEYKNILEQLDELKEVYPEVEAAANVLSETWLVGTQEYTEALSQVQDKLYEAKMASLTDSADTKIDELQEYLQDAKFEAGLDLDDSEFQDKLDDVLDAEYEIDVAIHTEAEDEFNDIVSAMDNINEQASLIGENFVVSANDIRELNNTFPGIIQGMRDLGDGSVQLNEEVAQSAIGMAQAEVAADSQATIQKLRNQADLLRQKQAVYQQMANAALILAQTETGSEQEAADAKAVISDNLAKLKGLNDQIQSQTEMDNDKATADASNENAEIVARNWSSAYQSAAQSSYQFAQTAVANMRAAAGQGSPVAPGDFGVNYAGSSGTSSEAKVIEGTQNALDSGNTSQDQWANLAQKYQMLADSAGAAANDIDGMIAQIGASNVEIGHNLGNIKSGKGPRDSGSSSKEKEPDQMDYVEGDIDRYHDVNIELEQISTTLDRLQKQQDKLFGQNLIDNLDKQLQSLNDQIDTTNEKIAIARGELSELRGELAQKGVSFNADGTIANYASAYQSQLNYVNSLIAQYNSMSAEAQEGFKEVVEQAQEDFDTFVDNIDRYDELISSEIPGLEDDIQDAIDKQIEIQIEKFNMEIEIRLDLAEAERDWNEFKRKVIDGIKDDDILGNAQARLQDFYSYYKEDGTGIIQANTEHVNALIDQLKQIESTGTSTWYGDNQAQALEDLKTYTDQLMSDLTDVEDLVEEIKDSYLDMMDEAADKFSDQINLYEQVKDIIDHDMNVIELVYGEDSYKDLEEYYQKQEDNYNAMIDFQRQQKDFWYNQMKAIEEAGGKNSEAWLQAKENWMDAVSEWNSSIEDAIENLQDKYLNAINAIFDELNDKVTGGLGLDYVSEEWELINANADQYLDTINSLYGIQDLENKYLDAIDSTDSISAQRELNDLMNEELTALREKDKLTQYDIDRANMKYEIALKQIALEEAQQNKSTMRLRRDSQGNYTYQYVSDDDQTGQLEDELSQLKNELYNFDLEHYRDNLDQVYSIWEEFQQKMAEAAMINDPEERQQRELLLREQYGELINGLVEQNETIRLNLNESAFTELADLYNIDYANFQQLSDQERDIMLSQMIPQWESGVQHMADVFAGEGGFVPTVQEAMDKLDDTTNEYQNDLNELQNAADQDFGSIKNGIDDTISKTQELITNNSDLISKYQEELNAIGAVISQLQALVSQYELAKNAAIAATEAAYGYWRAQQRQAANAAGNSVSGGGSSSSSGSGSGSSSSSSGGSSGSSSGGGASVGNKITYTGKYYYDSYGTSPAGSRYAGVSDGVVIDIVNNNPYGIHIKSSDGRYPDLGWIKRSQVTRWNTGGYTGDWGNDSGKLAILDRKELVLNKDDTSNMLNMVEITRDLMNSMNSSMMNRISNSLSGIKDNTSNQSLNSEQLEQNVHIEATFPGVRDAKEIEEALNNLTNIAAQRIHRRK